MVGFTGKKCEKLTRNDETPIGKRWKKHVEFMSTKLVYLPRYPIMKNQTVSLWLNGKTMGVPVVSG